MLKVLHRPVFMKPVLSFLKVQRGIYVDATVGTGGHSLGILHRLEEGRLIALDQDLEALETARPILETTRKEFRLYHKNFRYLREVLHAEGVSRVTGILFDLGVSQLQLSDPERGFSYQPGGRLDMRMNEKARRSASWYLRHLPEERLVWVFSEYGEIAWARTLTRAIIRLRNSGCRFETADDLLEAIRTGVPPGLRKRKDPRPQVFMALRILVNDELGALDETLDFLPEVMATGGRTVFLTYHSLEDRRVKRAYLRWRDCGLGRILKPFPLMMTREEAKGFPQARSARLRAFEWEKR
ncbi:MAG: 16S rRNA (cytosine(1402)-N(4))-methyltransferase RsmH [bacterium JZ-2024 1]